MPTTWDALKRAMRTHFVPLYYQREMLQKLTRLQQGKKSVEEYYQELQTGLIRCGLVEDNEAMLARFLNGLNIRNSNNLRLQGISYHHSFISS